MLLLQLALPDAPIVCHYAAAFPLVGVCAAVSSPIGCPPWSRVSAWITALVACVWTAWSAGLGTAQNRSAQAAHSQQPIGTPSPLYCLSTAKSRSQSQVV